MDFRILRSLQARPLSKAELVAALGYHSMTGHIHKALDRLDSLGLIALTIPDKPRSKSQKRRLTAKGRRFLEGVDATK